MILMIAMASLGPASLACAAFLLPAWLIEVLRHARRDEPVAVTAAVTKLGGGRWEKVRARIAAARNDPPPVEVAADALLTGDWATQLAAWHALVARGEEATTTWLAMRRERPLRSRDGARLRPWVEAGLAALAADAPASRGRDGARVCRDCLVPFRVVWRRWRTALRACPRCGRVSTAIPGGPIVLCYDRRLGGRRVRRRGEIVLDARAVAEHVVPHADRIELVDASRVEVEALAIRWSARRPDGGREDRPPVRVSRRAPLGAESLRILARTFSRVELAAEGGGV